MCVIIMIVAFGFAIQHFLIGNYFSALGGMAVGIFFLLMLINNIRTMQARKAGRCDQSCKLTEWIKSLFKNKES